MSWSFGLLDGHLQRVFADLSVFAGPFTAADAAAVCGARRDGGHGRPAAAGRAVARRCGRRTGGTCCSRRCGRSAPSSSRPTGGPSRRASAMPVTRSTGSRRPTGGCSSRAADADSPRSTPASPSCAPRSTGCSTTDEVELAGRLVVALLDYGFLRLRPDVLAWAERVSDADPEDRSPLAPGGVVVAAYAAWMAGDVAETGVRSRARPARRRAGRRRGAGRGGHDLRQLRAVRGSPRRGGARGTGGPARPPAAIRPSGCWRRARRCSPSPTPAIRAAADVAAGAARRGRRGSARRTPPYAWYCAGEADLAGDVERARTRFARALELAERTRRLVRHRARRRVEGVDRRPHRRPASLPPRTTAG